MKTRNRNAFVADQSNNNGLLFGSLTGSRKEAEQFNQVSAPNGLGQANDNAAVVRQVDGSLLSNFWAPNTKVAHQVNEVFAPEGTASFNTLVTEQRDNSLTGGLFNGKISQQDNILNGSGDVIGNVHHVTQQNRGLLGKRGLYRRRSF